KEIWKNNLACTVICKAKELGIGIIAKESLWKITGYGLKIRDMLDRKTYKDASASLRKIEIAYISQLFDQNGINMFTWDQIKRCKNMSSKGRVAKWYKKLEEIILKNMNSRLVQEEFKLEEINKQSIRKKANKVTKDRRKKEWVLCNSQNNRVIGKIRSKEDRKTLIEHWETREDSESLRTELVRCT